MNDVIDSSLGSDSATSAVDALPGQVGQTSVRSLVSAQP